jgi:hypothetical protein
VLVHGQLYSPLHLRKLCVRVRGGGGWARAHFAHCITGLYSTLPRSDNFTDDQGLEEWHLSREGGPERTVMWQRHLPVGASLLCWDEICSLKVDTAGWLQTRGPCFQIVSPHCPQRPCALEAFFESCKAQCKGLGVECLSVELVGKSAQEKREQQSRQAVLWPNLG